MLVLCSAGPTSSLPHWEQASNSQVYSNVSMNSTHEQDIDIASAMKSDQDTHSGEQTLLI